MRGGTVAVATAQLQGASAESLVLAGAFGGSFGYAGYLVDKSDRGVGGAHGSGTGLGIVDIMGGSGTSTAMRVSAGVFGGVGGFLIGTQWSAEAGNNAALGSFLGGSLGRRADIASSLVTSYAYQRIGRPLVAWSYRMGGSSFVNYIGRGTFVSRLVGKMAGNKVADWLGNWFSSTGRVGSPWEWTGSATGVAIGGVGTALVHTSDTHFNRRMGQLGGLINQARVICLGLF